MARPCSDAQLEVVGSESIPAGRPKLTNPAKKKKTVHLREDTLQALEALAVERNVSFEAALRIVIREYFGFEPLPEQERRKIKAENI